MSKQIDWSKPLSKADREWAEQFPGLHAGLIEANLAAYPPEQEASLEGDDSEVPYTEWTAEELSDEIKRRNQAEGKSLAVPGKKADRIRVLEEDDEASAR